MITAVPTLRKAPRAAALITMALAWVPWRRRLRCRPADQMVKIEAMQAKVDLLKAMQAKRDEETREQQEKTKKNLESLMAALMRGTSDTAPPATPTKRSTPETPQEPHTGAAR